MPPVISSRQNPLCKLVRSLHAAKGRREQGLFLAEGSNSVEAAIDSNWPIQKLFCPEAKVLDWQSRAPSVEIQTATPEILEYLSEAQTSTGVLALCAMPQPTSQLEFRNCLLILDGVGDPGNVGTLIRSADAAGAGGVLCTANSADPFSPKTVRSSAGSLFHLPPVLLENASTSAVIEGLQNEGVPFIVAVGDGDSSCFDYPWPEKCALVLGHETRGVSAAFDSVAIARVNIPIYGRAESLNVASAGTVLLYAWRNRVSESIG